MMKLLITACLISFISFCSAQPVKKELPIQCSGKLPGDFTTLSSVKSEIQIQKEKSEYKSSSRVNNQKSQFISQSNYIIDELLLSGRVIFNDSISGFLSGIMDIILADEEELRKKIRIYALRSNSVNALTTNQGIIFVTTGLIAEVENEAQLAFILAHEITHYEKRHVINSFLENEKIFSSSGSYRYNTYDDRIEAASSYSKELEYQSDSMGIHRIAKTKYSLQESVNTMDILQFADLPFDEIKFDPSFLNGGDIIIPEIFFLDSVEPIDLDRLENENDSRSSHPNIKSRRERLKNYHQKLKSSTATEKYLKGKDHFDRVQLLARNESIRIMLNDRRYAETIYESLVLLKNDSANMYYKKAIGKALYGAAKYKTADDYSETADSYGRYEGEIQQCMYMLKQLTPEQINFLACRYLYDLSGSVNSKFYKDIRNDLFIDLINEYKFNYEYLKLKTQEHIEKTKVVEIHDSLLIKDSLVENITEEGSKYERLRKQKTEAVTKVEKTTIDPKHHEFHYGTFSDLIENPEFIGFMNEMSKLAEEEKSDKNEKEKIESKLTSYQKNQKEMMDRQKRIKKGVSLGIDSVIIVDPFYFELDRRRAIAMVDSEKKLVNFSVDIKDLAQKAELNTQIIAPKLFTESAVADYNNMSLFNFWVGERLDHENIDIIPLESEYAVVATDHLGTNKIIYSGVFSFREQKDNIGWAILASIVPYTAPFGIYYLAKPNVHTYYYTLLFDVETGVCQMNETIHFNMEDKRGMIRSCIYDLMLQIKREPKLKK